MKQQNQFLVIVVLVNFGHAFGWYTPAYKMKSKMIDSHNKYRSEAGIKNLTWSSDLAACANVWANTMAENGFFNHSKIKGGWKVGNIYSLNGATCTIKYDYGENLFFVSKDSYYVSYATKYYMEEKVYCNNADCTASKNANKSIGHYTQMMWHRTGKVGCADAQGGGNIYSVCWYSTPGNIVDGNNRQYKLSESGRDFRFTEW